jgi:hypothetical protein
MNCNDLRRLIFTTNNKTRIALLDEIGGVNLFTEQDKVVFPVKTLNYKWPIQEFFDNA